ncbi:hypothetical protein SCHPADRAFT_907005 [Schizopora paradoxa]|uniref:Uncharacterized protein n=1 Tax=Schizopora paradoxa TaxID=27342 RepID=A0A0H2REQ4_9AGAM|nr:hypothetical protein SCHPADRAFT_907005 [Schizopora paradoxa]
MFSPRDTQSPRAHSNVEVIGLFRALTVSSIDTDATADDLPGAGRTVGRLVGSLGSKLENFMSKRAERAGLGPKAVTDEICRLAGHRHIYLDRGATYPFPSLQAASSVNRRQKACINWFASYLDMQGHTSSVSSSSL